MNHPLSRLGRSITTDILQSLSARIELGDDGIPSSGDEEPIGDVVSDFLCNEAILYSCALVAAENALSQVIRIDVQASPVISVPLDYGVNARQTTSIDSPIVQVLERGNTYPVIGRTANSAWVQIQLDEEVAWVFTSAVFSSSTELTNLPVVTPPPVAVTSTSG